MEGLTSLMGAGASANPYAAAASAVTGMAAGGPSSAESGGGDSSFGGDSFNFGGNGRAVADAPGGLSFLQDDLLGVPAYFWLAGLVSVVVLLKR